MPGKGFWSSLGKRESMGRLQWIGLLILLLVLAALFIGGVFELWPEGSAPWWQKLEGYGIYAVLGGVLALAIVIPNTKRRKGLLFLLLFFLLVCLVFLLGQHFPLFS